jgi:ferrochelatase
MSGEQADRVGVLVMAHGTPSGPEDVERFYTSIRRGRAPSVEQLGDLRRRYDAIGGTSHLTARTDAQVRALRAELDRHAPGRYLVEFGAKHVDPTIEAAAAGLLDAGVERVIGLVLTPHPSSVGAGEYLGRAAGALASRTPPVTFVGVDGWYEADGFVELLGRRVRAAVAVSRSTSTSAVPDQPLVIFTAHSIPQRVVSDGDAYPDHVARSASLVAAAAGLTTWRVAWQSAGRTPEPWVGPDLLDVVAGLPSEGVASVVVCPIGFVADHLEVLFDLDIEGRAAADAAGLTFARTASLNDDPEFVQTLAAVVLHADRAGVDARA